MRKRKERTGSSERTRDLRPSVKELYPEHSIFGENRLIEQRGRQVPKEELNSCHNSLAGSTRAGEGYDGLDGNLLNDTHIEEAGFIVAALEACPP